MNAIIYPIMPSITKFDGFVISFNNTYDKIESSLQELQLQHRIEIAQQQKIQQENQLLISQSLQNHQTTSIFLDYNQIETHDLKNSHQIFTNWNHQTKIENFQQIMMEPASFQELEMLLINDQNSKSTPKFDDIKFDRKIEPTYKTTNTSKKKKIYREKENQLFSFKKRSINSDLKQLKSKEFQKNQEKYNQFYITIPSLNQSFITDFSSLGFKNLGSKTINDLIKQLNYQSDRISQVLYFNKETQLSRVLDLEEKLCYLELKEIIEIQIILKNKQGIQQIIKYEFGELEFLFEQMIEFDRDLCYFAQDCVEIHKSLLSKVNKITFYNFGLSNDRAKKLKEEDFHQFKIWVYKWCESNNFEILQIDNNLIVGLK